MSCNVIKRTFGHMRITKIQISLRIPILWSESLQGAFRDSKTCKVSSCEQQTARMRQWLFIVFLMIYAVSSKNLYLKMSSVYVVCWIFYLVFAYRQTVWTQIRLLLRSSLIWSSGAVWSGSTLFTKMTFNITSRWQSRRQLLWLAV